MTNVALPVYEVIRKDVWTISSPAVVRDKKRFNKEDTYYIVFSVNQKEQQELFEKEFAKEIIFKSDPAFNINHPTSGNRNTLFIFEMQE